MKTILTLCAVALLAVTSACAPVAPAPHLSAPPVQVPPLPADLAQPKTARYCLKLLSTFSTPPQVAQTTCAITTPSSPSTSK